MIGTTAAIILAASAAAGQIGAAKIASNASKNAAKTQADAATKAADYSQAATDRALDYIDRSRASTINPTANSPAYARLMGSGLQRYQPAASPSGPPPYAQLFGGGSGGGMVTMRAPNGMTKPVPADQVAHYRQLGAELV